MFDYYLTADDVLSGSVGNMSDEDIDRDVKLFRRIAQKLGIRNYNDLIVVPGEDDYNPDYYAQPLGIFSSNLYKNNDSIKVWSVDGIDFVSEELNGTLYLYFKDETTASKYKDMVDIFNNDYAEGTNESLNEELDSDEWEEIASKQVIDFDGFWTDYTLYYNESEGRFVCIFGDKDLYNPTNTDPDFECEEKWEAFEWFDDYDTGEPDGEDDTIYESQVNDSLKESKKPINENLDSIEDDPEFMKFIAYLLDKFVQTHPGDFYVESADIHSFGSEHNPWLTIGISDDNGTYYASVMLDVNCKSVEDLYQYSSKILDSWEREYARETSEIDENLSLNESGYENVIADLESIEKFLTSNNFYNYEVYNYDNFPMGTSKIDFEVKGDWKHDHLFFKTLINEWAEQNNRKIFKIDSREVGESDSDYYTAIYSVYITKDDDSFNTLNSMRGLFAESLDTSNNMNLNESLSQYYKIGDPGSELVYVISAIRYSNETNSSDPYAAVYMTLVCGWDYCSDWSDKMGWVDPENWVEDVQTDYIIAYLSDESIEQALADNGYTPTGKPSPIYHYNEEKDRWEVLKESLSVDKYIRESLNELDNKAINEDTKFYDLRSLYEAFSNKLTPQQKQELKKVIDSTDDAEIIAAAIETKTKNEAFDDVDYTKIEESASVEKFTPIEKQMRTERGLVYVKGSYPSREAAREAGYDYAFHSRDLGKDLFSKTTKDINHREFVIID